jgi:DNA-binding winged helix-turn-helix (wHTH) protein
MYKDEIIDEVWKNRKAYVERHHHDLEEIISDLKARQKQSDRLIVDRRSMPNKAIQSDSLGARR